MRKLLFTTVFSVYVIITFAQNDTIKLSSVTISDYYAPKQLKNTARIIQVINKKEISSIPAQSVNELLMQISQVDIRQRGVGNIQSDISIRGGTFNQVLILLNGIIINDPQTGHFNLDLPISLADIQRIEILEGPASNLYGPYALNGAINIVTETQDNKNEIFAKLSGGYFNYYKGAASVKYHTGKVQQLISTGKIGSDGYRNNTDYQTFHGFYQLSAPIRKNNILFQAGLNNKKFGANSFYSATFPEQYEETKTFFSSIKFSGGKKIHYSPLLGWRRRYDYFLLKRNNPDFYKNNHLTDVFQLEIPFHITSKIGNTAFGSGIRKEIIYSTALGDIIRPTVSIPNDTGYYPLGTHRKTFHFFLDHTYFFKNIYLNGGIMINSLNMEKPEVFPSLNISYRFLNYYKWFGLINKSLRYPTFTELYYPGLQNTGNPNLKPEKALSFETGLKLHYKDISGHISLFKRYANNVIDWIKKTDTSIWESSNITTLTTYGTSVSLTYHFNERSNKFLSFKKIIFNYQYVDNIKNETEFISHYALEYLKHKLNLLMVTNFTKNFEWTVTCSYNDRNGQYYDENNILKPYNPYFLINTKLDYSLKNICFFAEIQNILNKEYINFGAIPMPGRMIFIGISLKHFLIY
ncbi:MAG TPA: TonB-dependent receptor [Bacteroidales bacterium]|nr:TonB-dependent receptor [Bacteroidales bacterium]